MKKYLFLMIGFVLLVKSISHADTKQMTIGISIGYPPFYFFSKENKPTGICIDIIDQVAEKLGITVNYVSYPWKRMLLYGKNGTVDGIMPLFKTPEREQFLLFPDSSLINEDNSLFTTSTSSIAYSGRLIDMVDKKIAVIGDFSYGVEFDQARFKDKMIANDNEQLINLVLLGRADLGIGNSKVIMYAAEKMGSSRRIRSLSPPVTTEGLFIGFSKASVSPDFVTSFDQQLQLFKASPDYQRIIKSYQGL